MTARKMFPRTQVGDESFSRMIIGTNWFLGFSHQTAAKDNLIKERNHNRKKIADILEVFFNNGVDTVLGNIDNQVLYEGIMDVQDRTSIQANIIATPWFENDANILANGFDTKRNNSILDEHKKLGVTLCMPHMSVTDNVIDKCMRTHRQMDSLCEMIRQRGMMPGLSTHMPESIVFADENELDVETYICLYNALGFLMQVEVDWVAKVIAEAKKPVLTIKPMAAGRIPPFQAFNFVWNTIRSQDMVCVGTMSPDEAAECIDISLGILENRKSTVALQETRSKQSLKKGNI